MQDSEPPTPASVKQLLTIYQDPTKHFCLTKEIYALKSFFKKPPILENLHGQGSSKLNLQKPVKLWIFWDDGGGFFQVQKGIWIKRLSQENQESPSVKAEGVKKQTSERPRKAGWVAQETQINHKLWNQTFPMINDTSNMRSSVCKAVLPGTLESMAIRLEGQAC